MAPEVWEALHRVRRDLQLKDCRNICSRWMAKAGIIGTNIDAYMGWGAKGMRGGHVPVGRGVQGRGRG